MDGESHTCGLDRKWRQKADDDNIDPAFGPIGNLLRGRLGLSKTYWFYALLGGFLVGMPFLSVAVLFLMSDIVGLRSRIIPVMIIGLDGNDAVRSRLVSSDRTTDHGGFLP